MQISLRAARVNANLNQEEAAKLLGISVSTLIKWEKHPEHISSLEQSKISEVYKMPVDFINFLPTN